ncbi:hypothetical protein [Stenotrophomonas forensis]|uniref:hypothetical protein n=1 Tax=Stenotrophomonas forensis TaxID=2871169 RepID=UPI0039C76134
MNTPNAPQKRGRKPKPEGEKPTQLTIRLPPKLKLGLELLARAQHRSLSQAVEWALNAGLSNFQLNNDSYYSSLSSLLDDVWDFTPVKGALTMLLHAPELMTYQDRIAAELVEYSVEMQALEQNRECEITHDELYEMADKHWPKIQQMAEYIISNALSPRGASLLDQDRRGWPGFGTTASPGSPGKPQL